MEYFWYLQKKSNVLFYFIFKENYTNQEPVSWNILDLSLKFA